MRLNRFNSFINKKSPRLSEQQLEELIEINKDAFIRLGDDADYDGMGNYGRFPPIKKIVKKRKLHEK